MKKLLAVLVITLFVGGISYPVIAGIYYDTAPITIKIDDPKKKEKKDTAKSKKKDAAKSEAKSEKDCHNAEKKPCSKECGEKDKK